MIFKHIDEKSEETSISSSKNSKQALKELNKDIYKPFPPNSLIKCYEVFEDKAKFYDVSKDEMIKNNIIGLLMYLDHPEIKDKIIHPLYLFLKFHKAISLYYNFEARNNNELITKLQDFFV